MPRRPPTPRRPCTPRRPRLSTPHSRDRIPAAPNGLRTSSSSRRGLAVCWGTKFRAAGVLFDALQYLDGHALRRLAHATGLPQPPTLATLLRRRAVNSPSAGGISPAQVASSSTPRSRGRISTSAATDVRKTPSSSRRGLVVCWGNKSRAAGGLVHASMFEFFASARCLGLSTSRR